MNIHICSRQDVLLLNDKNLNIISFYDDEDGKVNYNTENNVIYCHVVDIDYDELDEYGLTYDSYFSEVNDVAKFIHKCIKNNEDIICQCEYGQGRSAGCAAAIEEYLNSNGIKIFADYKYHPNKLIFNKLLNALIGLNMTDRELLEHIAETVSELENSVKNIEFTLENDVSKKISIIAEAHGFLG